MDPRYAEIQVSDHVVTFETSCAEAYNYLSEIRTLSFMPYQFREITSPNEGTRLLYCDSSDYNCVYEESRDTLFVTYPWDNADSIMQILLWHIFELKRQRAGEYIFHASAVVRNGSAVVLTGPSEAGKTTIAVDLCRNYGFAFYSNDAVVMRLRTERPFLVSGDSNLRLRLSSFREYNTLLADRIFGDELLAPRPWEIKRDIAAEEINIESVSGQFPLCQMVFVRLDRSSGLRASKTVDWSDCNSQRYFHNEMAASIRGGIYAPQPRPSLMPLFIPSLDSPCLFKHRLLFMEKMQIYCFMHSLRGNLAYVTGHIDCIQRVSQLIAKERLSEIELKHK
jgi:hypothetical protein